MADSKPGSRRILRSARLSALLLAPFLPSLGRQAPPPAEPGLRFAAEEVTLWEGRSHVLTFEIAEPSAQERWLEARVEDPTAVEILDAPHILAARREGSVRLRGLRAGRTRLAIGGSAIALAVRTPREHARIEDMSVRIVSPVAGAFAWDRIAIGVEVEPGAGDALSPDATVALALSDGSRLEHPRAVPDALERTCRFVFELDTALLDVDSVELTALVTDEEALLVESAPVRIHIARPVGGALFAFECEASNASARPASYGPDHPAMIASSDASIGRYVACYKTRPSCIARVAIESPGRYQLCVRARGELAAGGLPSVSLCVDDPKRASAAGRIVDTSWQRHLVGAPIELAAGEHLLAFRYSNDASGRGTADRNLHLDAFELLRVGEPRADRAGEVVAAMERAESMSTSAESADANGVDESEHLLVAFEPPFDRLSVNGPFQVDGLCRSPDASSSSAARVALLYPRDGQALYGADALVAEAFESERIDAAELLIDGEPSGCFARRPTGLGAIVLPFALRELEPGEHRLALRVVDDAGKRAISTERNVRVFAAPPDEPGPYERAVRLLNRLAYGPDEAELAAVLTLGERAWLEDRLAPLQPRDRAALDVAQACMLDLGSRQVSLAVLRHALRSQNPVRARLAFWIDDHFSTWMPKAGAAPEWRDHLEYVRLATAPFVESLWTSVTSRAMLCYLDQHRSFAGKLNENYARELLELHTLGVDGGYTQADVTALAGLLAGLTISEEASLAGDGSYVREFRYDAALGDREPHELMGLRFDEKAGAAPFDRVRRVVELLADHPSTARHVARALAEHYVAVPAPEELVDELAGVYARSGGDLRELVLALAAHASFHARATPARVCTPLEYGLRLARACDDPGVEGALNDFLARSGMGIFNRPTPDGWPEGDAAWIGTNATLQRWRFADERGRALALLVPEPERRRPTGDARAWHQRLVDAVALRLFGRTLEDTSNEAALAMLGELQGTDAELVERAAIFVARAPEADIK